MHTTWHERNAQTKGKREGEENTKIQRQKPKIRQKLTKILSDTAKAKRWKKIMERRPGYKSAKIKYSLAVAKKQERAKRIEALQRKTGRTNRQTDRLADWQTDATTTCCGSFYFWLFGAFNDLHCTANTPPTSPRPPLARACAVCVTSDCINALCGTTKNRKHFASRCTNRSASKLTII